jgi:hypothetical protein
MNSEKEKDNRRYELRKKISGKSMDIMKLIEELIEIDTEGKSHNGSFEKWKKEFYNYERSATVEIESNTHWLTEVQAKIWPKKLSEVKDWPDVNDFIRTTEE